MGEAPSTNLQRTSTLQPQTKIGWHAAKSAALLDLIEDYEAVIGQPVAARARRKAKTSDLRLRVRAVDGFFAGKAHANHRSAI